MSIRRLRARVPSAVKVDIGSVEKHELKFHKVSKIDGSAKCNIMETGDPLHVVYGVVFHIAYREKAELDRIEGTGFGYDQKYVDVMLTDGSVVQAFTYHATDIAPGLKPLDWYKQHVLIGARENRLPEKYISLIEAIEAIEDKDMERRERELVIYR